MFERPACYIAAEFIEIRPTIWINMAAFGWYHEKDSKIMTLQI